MTTLEAQYGFPALAKFARENADALRDVFKFLQATPGEFGFGLLSALDREIRSPSASASFVPLLKLLAPIHSPEKSRLAGDFWNALTMDAADHSKLRRSKGRQRTLYGVTPINMFQQYARAERMCGVMAETMVFSAYHIGRDFDLVLDDHQNTAISVPGNLLYEFRGLVMIWALVSFDIFNLFNDRGILEPAGGYGSDRFGIALRELDTYRAAGKTVYTHAFGADHRMRRKTLALGRWNFCVDCPAPGTFCVCDDEGGEQMLAQINQRVDAMVTSGLAMSLIPGAHNLYGLPVDTSKLAPSRQRARSAEAPLRVGHFPNHGFFKGTVYLEEAIERLRADGVAIDYVSIAGKPHEQVIAEMQTIDLLVDQLISGCFGLTGLEGMALSKPVVCHRHPGVAIASPEMCPTIEANPTTIEGVLRKLALERRSELPEIGRRGRAYVLENYSLPSFAARLAEFHLEKEELPSAERMRLARRHHDLRKESELSAAVWRTESTIERLSGQMNISWLRVKRSALFNRAVLDPIWRCSQAVRRRIQSGLKRRTTKFNVAVKTLNLRIGGKAFQLAKSALVAVLGPIWRCYQAVRRRIQAGLKRRTTEFKVAVKTLILRIGGKAFQLVESALVAVVRWRGARRLAKGKLRSVWYVTPILTLPLLARCDRLLGMKSESLTFQSYHITSGFDVALQKWEQRVARWSMRVWRVYPAFRWIVFSWMLLRYDIFHCFYDHGILLKSDRFGISKRELDMYRRTNIRLYTYAYGADVRTRQTTLALGSPNLCADCPEPGKFCICDEDQLASSIARLDGVVTAKIAMGDMTAYVSGCRDMHYWPIDTTKLSASPLPARSGPLRVAHAPNHAQFKGTRHLEEAIGRLRREGHEIELVRVQGVPNSEVLDLFRSCHIVADQFVAGFHGYTALEAMALGRPVLCFLRNSNMAMCYDSCPIINTGPDEVYCTLLNCLDGKLDLNRLGIESRIYVERHCSLEAVAARLGRLYVDTGNFDGAMRERLQARISELEACPTISDSW